METYKWCFYPPEPLFTVNKTLEEPMKESRGTVYLAGPMRGLPQYNFPAFYAAQAILELWGYTVINPARLDIEAGKAQWNVSLGEVVPDTAFTIEDALLRDFTEIMEHADAIVVLPGWEQSVGAQREVAFGTSIGQPVYAYDPTKPLSFDDTLYIDVQVDLQCYDANRRGE